MKRVVNKVLGPIDPVAYNSKGPSLRKTLEKIKFALTYQVLGYKNSMGVRDNLVYSFYHLICRWVFKIQQWSTRFEYNGEAALFFDSHNYFKKDPESGVLSALDSIDARIQKELSDPANRNPKFEFLTRYFFKHEEIPQLLPLITPEVDRTLKSILKSNYLITSAYAYRQVAGNVGPSSTWLWHSDDHPDCHVKIFFFANDVHKNTGAMRFHSWQNTKFIKKMGFQDRRRVSPEVQSLLDQENKIILGEGKRGTALFFNANTIHKAVIPENHYRDLVTLEVIPSPYKEVMYLGDDMNFWQSPAKIISDLKPIQTP